MFPFSQETTAHAHIEEDLAKAEVNLKTNDFNLSTEIQSRKTSAMPMSAHSLSRSLARSHFFPVLASSMQKQKSNSLDELELVIRERKD